MRAKNKGITLITLITTIIILLILIGVGTKIMIDQKIIKITQRSVNETNNKVNMEQGKVNYLLGEINGAIQSSCIHEWETKETTKQSTCSEAGSKTVECKKCGAVSTLEIPTIEHTFVNGTCSVCGATE